MTHVIAVCNQKGGVGKTTTTYHLARAAIRTGRRVLALDMDPQADLTALLAGADLDADSLSVADVLSPRAAEGLAEVIVPGIWDRLDVAPASEHALAAVREELVGIPVGRESRLRAALSGGTGEYDLVLIDCPPELGQLTINALVAAQSAVVVAEARLLASRGTGGMVETIETVRSHYNPGLAFAGVIVNKHEAATITGRHRLAEMAQAVQVLEPVIPKAAAINDAAEAGVGLDEWPSRGHDLAALYEQHISTLTESATTAKEQ